MLIAELLELAPGIRVIISSRTALRIRGEHTFDVEPLGLPGDDSAAAVADSPAVQLFLQRATEANRKLEIDATLSRTVASICRALDGLPLAIELAASRSRSFSPAQIADQIANAALDRRALDPGSPRLASRRSRRRSAGAMTCSPPARSRSCAARAVFLGGFTLPALEAVADGPVGSEIDELLEASLVRRQSGDGRYELLELVRAFAHDQLRTRAGWISAAAPAPPIFRCARGSGGEPRSTTVARRVSSPLRCWPITPTSGPHWRTQSRSAISHRRWRSRSGCDRSGSPGRSAGKLRSSPIACSTASRYRASRRSRCCERWRISTTARPRQAGTVGWPRCATEIGDQEALTVATGNLFAAGAQRA